jgi:hypothetical protein
MPESNDIHLNNISTSGRNNVSSATDTPLMLKNTRLNDSLHISYDTHLPDIFDSSDTIHKDSLNAVVGSTSEAIEEIRFDGTLRPYSFKTEDGITGLLLMSFLLFSSVYNKGIDFIRQMVQNLFEVTERDSIFVDSTTINEFRFKAFLLTQSTILLDVFAYIIIYLSPENPILHPDGKKTFICIFAFTLIIFLFWGIKWIVNFFIGKTFFNQKKVNIWQNNYYSAIELLGIALFPIILFLVNSRSQTITKICLFLVFGLIAISFILTVYKGFRVFLTKPYGIFYFMLYLCALEILPYMGLYMGLEYIYNLVEFNAL